MDDDLDPPMSTPFVITRGVQKVSFPILLKINGAIKRHETWGKYIIWDSKHTANIAGRRRPRRASPSCSKDGVTIEEIRW